MLSYLPLALLAVFTVWVGFLEEFEVNRHGLLFRLDRVVVITWIIVLSYVAFATNAHTARLDVGTAAASFIGGLTFGRLATIIRAYRAPAS